MKKVAIGLIVFMFAILALSIATGIPDVSITVNGQVVKGPMKFMAESFGLVVVLVTLLCVAALMAFLLSGIALLVLGILVAAGLISLVVWIPFLLPIVIPVFIIAVFFVLAHKKKNDINE